jgi:hypothetical protein
VVKTTKKPLWLALAYKGGGGTNHIEQYLWLTFASEGDGGAANRIEIPARPTQLTVACKGGGGGANRVENT